MKLRGIDFGSVLGASGVEGFFGEGYWFHRPLAAMGFLDFSGMTFVSKTATLLSREGNMPLTRQYTPRSLFPRCIKAKPFRRLMLNAVGLSNPGIGALLGTGMWQTRTEPFMISVMPVATTPEKRREELRIIVDLIGFSKDSFQAPFGLQINESCPNLDGESHDPCMLIGETAEHLEIASMLGVPRVPKFSIASAPIPAILELERDANCDGICVSNTIPFGWPEMDWEHVWGSCTSPLARFGGGGLSGAALLPLVCAWIKALREEGFTKPINGGGGIMDPDGVDRYHEAGASSIFLGTIVSERPQQVQPTIQRANALDWRNSDG